MSAVSSVAGPAIAIPLVGGPGASASASSSASVSASSSGSLSPAVLAADGAARAGHMARKVAREIPVRVPTIKFTSVDWEIDIKPLEKDLGSSVRGLKYTHKEPVELQLRLNKAKWQIQKGNWTAAAQEAQAGLDIEHPNYADSSLQESVYQVRSELALLCAYAHNQLRNWEAAVKAVKLEPKGDLPKTMIFDLFMQKAFALCHDRKPDDALAICDQAIALDLDDLSGKAYVLKAHLHNAKGESDDAIKAATLGMSGADDLTKAELANEQTCAYLVKGMRTKAIAAAQNGLSFGGIPDQLVAELSSHKAQAHLSKSEWDRAIQAANTALSLRDISDEIAAKIWHQKAQAHRNKGETDDALAAAKFGLALGSSKAETRLELMLMQAQAHLIRNEHDDVLSVVTTALQIGAGSDQTKAELCLRKARAHSAKGEKDNVIITAAQGVGLNGASDQVRVELYLLKAEAHKSKNQFDDVITAAAAGVALAGASNQTRSSLNNLKLYAHYTKGEDDNAIATGQAGHALVAGVNDSTKGDLYWYWGLAHMKKGEWMKAVKALKYGTTALKQKYPMRPLRSSMHGIIAECYNRDPKEGKTRDGKDNAELAAREALRLRPGDALAQAQLKIALSSIRPDGYRTSVLSEVGGVLSRHNPCPCDDDD
ncbi:MAG: hypothetical protein P0S96_01740 [Simkaniaceae bacterium]|nr:hypothetical protein [Candidatus Sacchlamyda saccharinae]